MAEVKFCENNFDHGTEEVIDRLRENHREVEISVESCLGYCGECAEGPFALVDDEMVKADSAEELYEAIEEMLT